MVRKVTHRHRFRRLCFSSKETTEQCGCGQQRVRETTAEERRQMDEDWKAAGRLHTLWHKFCHKFGGPDEWKKEGYDLSNSVTEWAIKRHPEILVTRCDDTYFSSSDIVLIPHQNESEFMGTTFLYIPQNSGTPATGFLYPNHIVGLIEALKRMLKLANKKPSRTRRMLNRLKRKKGK